MYWFLISWFPLKVCLGTSVKRVLLSQPFAPFCLNQCISTVVAVSFGPWQTSPADCLWSTRCCLCKFPHECKKEILLLNLRELRNNTVWWISLRFFTLSIKMLDSTFTELWKILRIQVSEFFWPYRSLKKFSLIYVSVYESYQCRVQRCMVSEWLK